MLMNQWETSWCRFKSWLNPTSEEQDFRISSQYYSFDGTSDGTGRCRWFRRLTYRFPERRVMSSVPRIWGEQTAGRLGHPTVHFLLRILSTGCEHWPRKNIKVSCAVSLASQTCQSRSQRRNGTLWGWNWSKTVLLCPIFLSLYFYSNTSRVCFFNDSTSFSFKIHHFQAKTISKCNIIKLLSFMGKNAINPCINPNHPSLKSW